MALFSHSIIYLLSTVANNAVPFLLLPILTRYLSPEDYGVVVNFQLIVAVFSTIIGFNVHAAISVQYFKVQIDRLKKYIALSILLILVSLFISILILILMDYLFTNQFPISLYWLIIACIVSFFIAVNNIRLVLWQVSGKPFQYGIFQFLQVALNSILSIALVINYSMGSEGRLIGISVAIIVNGFFGLFLLFYEKWFHFEFDKEIIKSILLFGVPLIPHTLAGIAITQADRFIIGKQLGLAESGVYAVAMQLSLPIFLVANAFNQAFGPWLFKNLSQQKKNKVVAISTGIGVLFTVGVIVYSFLVVWLISWFVTDKLGRASEKTNFLSIITVLGGLLYVIFGWFATLYLKEVGLALVFSIIGVVQTVAVFFLSNKVYPLPWFSLQAHINGWKDILKENKNLSVEV